MFVWNILDGFRNTAGKLICWVVLFWLLTTPALRYLLQKDQSVYLLSGIAALICITPAILAFTITEFLFFNHPGNKILASFAFSIVRMFYVVGAALYLTTRWDFFQSYDFLVWLSAYYLLILTLETYLVIKQRLRSIGPTD